MQTTHEMKKALDLKSGVPVRLLTQSSSSRPALAERHRTPLPIRPVMNDQLSSQVPLWWKLSPSACRYLLQLMVLP